MLDNVYLFCQSSIKIQKSKTIYFDPFKMEEEYHDADIIFVTHDHFDHFDVESINKIIKDDTKIVVPTILLNQVKELFDESKIVEVEPNNDYSIDGIDVHVMPSYNINKQFHPKEKNYVGYIVSLDNISYYAMGDTDAIDEAKNVKCDVLFIPIGGTYTMDVNGASTLTNIMKPKVVVPIHYGSVVGKLSDGNDFKNEINQDIECVLLMK